MLKCYDVGDHFYVTVRTEIPILDRANDPDQAAYAIETRCYHVISRSQDGRCVAVQRCEGHGAKQNAIHPVELWEGKSFVFAEEQHAQADMLGQAVMLTALGNMDRVRVQPYTSISAVYPDLTKEGYEKRRWDQLLKRNDPIALRIRAVHEKVKQKASELFVEPPSGRPQPSDN